MSLLKDNQNNTLGSVSAMQTLLNFYPKLEDNNTKAESEMLNTSIGFLLSLSDIIGITEQMLIDWVSKLFAGDTNDGKNGILNVIEETIKLILLTNMKNMYTCSVDPLIPDFLLKSPGGDHDGIGVTGININLDNIDMFGYLRHCPIDKDSQIFYFDSYNSIYSEEEKEPYYNINDLYKSCDFDAFLWYVVNRGSLGSKEQSEKNLWDNRVKYISDFRDDNTLAYDFFNTSTVPTGEAIVNGSKKLKKKGILLCEYNDMNAINIPNHILKVYANGDLYASKYAAGPIHFNKTIFEFNYDYIYSLKLFDPKTLIASIINSLYGLSSGIGVDVNLELQIVRQQIEKTVEKIIESNDKEVEDCYYTFSNDEYDALLQKATLLHEGLLKSSINNAEYINVKVNDIIDSINNIKNSTTLNEQIKTISETLGKISETYYEQSISVNGNFSYKFKYDFIMNFIKQSVTEIVLHVLTPKVAVLYAINSSVMKSDATDFKGWLDFITDMPNLITSIILEVKDIIVKELMRFVMEKLNDLIQLFAEQLILESIKYYKDILVGLMKSCMPQFNFNLFMKNLGMNGTIIDNVDYADIVPTQNNDNINKGC